MATFTDIFIKRPVLSWAISLMIFALGLKAISNLAIQGYPTMTNTTITITTSYPGASADLIEGFITSVIEKSVASSDGIDYLTSDSQQGTSTITAYIKLNFDPNDAFTSILSNVQAVINQLPPQSQQPVITKSTGSQIALMYIGFGSDEMTPEQITEYLNRVVVPKLQAIQGISQVQVLGGSTYAMRIWLDPAKMAALNVTPADVSSVLTSKNYQSAAGATKGDYVAYNINAQTDLHDQSQFANIIVKSNNGSVVRLKDIAKIELGAQSYDYSVVFNGKKGVFLGIQQAPGANPLTIINNIDKTMPELEKEYPPSLKSNIVYDSTEYIRASIEEVASTIVEAAIIVIVVIFLFIGSLRSVVIPVITIPLSLVGVCSLMLALGFSINLLTLLAMVLAIGLVVDDAIVVVENVFRHIEEGLSPFQAAIVGAREIAVPVISMTITLAAVYAPIGFMGGITGSLFKEFAFTLAMSVIISGVIALTLSPMLCSRMLNANIAESKTVKYIDHTFEKIKTRYQRLLHGTLNYRPVTVVFACVVLLSCAFLFMNTPSELAPEEDQGVVFVQATAPEYANIDYVQKFTQEFDKTFTNSPGFQDYFIVNGDNNSVNSIIAGDILKPWSKRSSTQSDAQKYLQNQFNNVAGLQVAAFPLPPLPTGGSNIPIQFEVTTTDNFSDLYQVSQKLLQAALKSGLFVYADNSLKFDQPQLSLNIDRDKAETLGISMQDIGNSLSAALSENYVNYFSMQGRSYQVIPQVLRAYRLNPNQIGQIYIKTANNKSIPLSTIATVTLGAQPNDLAHFQQLNSATIEGILAPGKTIGQGLAYLQEQAKQILPKGYTYDYAGQSRQFMQEGNALVATFFFALIVIYLVLAAQFESFRDPLIILVSVPMSICGALIFLNLGLATVNIYTQVGLITLVGLISKHGILMTDFANHLQINEGLSIREAIEKSAAIRLRPILMTTAAMVLGVVPLLIASGAGAASRFDIGLVIAAGMSIGTVFTLFVVPTMYTFIAKRKQHQPPEVGEKPVIFES